MSNRIVYLMSGDAHCPYLLVSLYTLRQYWAGDVHIHAWPESYDVVERIARDRRLFVDRVDKREPQQRGKNSQFLDKIRLVRSMDGEAGGVMYLDADTSIHGSLQPLFDGLQHYSFIATQFNDWTTESGIVRGRIEKLKGIPGINDKAVDLLLASACPSVNGGVWSCRPASPVLSTWEAWTLAAKEQVFIADEAALHVMQVIHEGDLAIADCRFNTSPKFQPKHIEASDVIVYHYHGDSNVRPAKSQRGYAIWWPMWSYMLEENIGGCREWYPTIRNKHMRRLEENDG